MTAPTAALIAALALPPLASAETHTVRNTDGAGANQIVFAPRLAGRSIELATPLPGMTDARTTIDGCTDGDQAATARTSRL